MTDYAIHSLALVGSPTAWAAIALLVIVIFAPRVLPSLAKLAGSLMQREVRRRLGVPEPRRNSPSRSRPSVEVIPPEPPRSRPVAPRHVEIIEAEPLPPRKPSPSLWWAAGGAISLLAVLSWILFHSR